MLLADIHEAWAWAGLQPTTVLDTNQFGNVLVSDAAGRCWRLCPEELSARVVAGSEDELNRLRRDERFVADWQMIPLVERARRRLGPLPDGHCYCLKIPAPLGGAYDEANFGTIAVAELIRFAGDLAQQIHDLPDGTRIRLTTAD